MVRRFLAIGLLAAAVLVGSAGTASADATVLRPKPTKFQQNSYDHVGGHSSEPASAGPLRTFTEWSGKYWITWQVTYALPRAASCRVTGATLSALPQTFEPDGPPFDQDVSPRATLFLRGVKGEPVDSVDFDPQIGSVSVADVTNQVAALVKAGNRSATAEMVAGPGTISWDGPGQPQQPTLAITCAAGDKDSDGVDDAHDVCARTPKRESPGRLKPDNYVNRGGHFVSGAGVDSGITVADAAGCSAIQIGRRFGVGQALSIATYGIPLATLHAWVAVHGPS